MVLSRDEKEVVAVYSDAERRWHVYSDSGTLRRAILRLAEQVGAEVRRVGDHGVEFDAPAEALRLAARRRLRLSGDQREARRERARRRPRHKADFGQESVHSLHRTPSAASVQYPNHPQEAAAGSGEH